MIPHHYLLPCCPLDEEATGLLDRSILIILPNLVHCLYLLMYCTDYRTYFFRSLATL